MNYQRDYAAHFPSVADEATRRRKAAKIMRVLEDHLGRNLAGCVCLDMGCSVGIITAALARDAAFTIGMDIDGAALRTALGAPERADGYLLADVGATPFPDASFDVIVCSQVYEHTPDLGRLVSEIHRLLRPGGACFFSGPNRWSVVEEHYHLPFLSWLPRRWADRYLRAAGRGAHYHERPLSAGELRRALRGFAIHDYTPALVAHPERYALEEEVGSAARLARHIPRRLWPALADWAPNFNWVLTRDG
jgi:2-polyprenyl-3-methyl-5-hydroxy-6-metoxy-1,4-benzoquinol methylase